MQHGNRLGIDGGNMLNIDSSFNIYDQSNNEDVPTKMGMEIHSGCMNSP